MGPTFKSSKGSANSRRAGGTVKTLQLEKLVQRIDNSFGEELRFSEKRLQPDELALLSKLFADDGFQRFLQDQVSRQIIRDYAVNALRQGYIEEDDLDALGSAVATVDGRSAVSLFMLMSALEDAPLFCRERVMEELEALQPGPDDPPHIEIVRN